ISLGTDEQIGTKDRPLGEGSVNRQIRLRDDVRVVDVGQDAHNPPWLRADVGILDERIGPHDVPVESVLTGEQSVRDALADDYNEFGSSPIHLREIAPLNKRNSQSGEVPRGNKTEARPQVLLAAFSLSSLNRELQGEGEKT